MYFPEVQMMLLGDRKRFMQRRIAGRSAIRSAVVL
jgi:hypothetical protein